MRGAASSMFTRSDDSPQSVTLKIWSKTGSTFEDIFSVDRTTFADVKNSAILYFTHKTRPDHLSTYPRLSFAQSINNRTNVNMIPINDIDNYKLISIESKRTIDEKKKLSEERVKDGDEYLLATKQLSKMKQAADVVPIDETLIDLRTEDLSRATRLFSRDFRFAGRTEFRTDLNCILITLIETSQKLLWCHPDAESIFKQAEEILSKSSADDSLPSTSNSNGVETRQNLVSKITDMGFTQRQAQLALKRSRNDVHAAMELLLVQPDFDDDTPDDDHQPEIEAQASADVPITPLFSRHNPFLSFRQYRQQRFQSNPRAIQSLKDMGFNQDDIIEALRRFNNDQNLACEYLLSDGQQQQNIIEANTDQGLDPKSSMFQAIMQNPIVQRTLNNPKTFFVMLKISENPSSIANYLNDPDIGNMLLQISRIYHAERDQMHTAMNHRRTSDQQERSSSPRPTESLGDFDNDSD